MPLLAVILGAIGPSALWPFSRRLERQTRLLVWVVGSMLYDAVITTLLAPFVGWGWITLGVILGCVYVNARDYPSL